MENSLVVVSRKWHEPFIRVDVTSTGIGVTMTLDDFVRALGAECGQELTQAAQKVVEGMKTETTRVL